VFDLKSDRPVESNTFFYARGLIQFPW
jgi:hypothetical protein